MLPARFKGFVTHAAFADDAAQAEIANDLPLVRLFANRGRRTRRNTFPCAAFIFDHNRSAMVKDTAPEIYAGGELAAFVKIFVHGIASGKECAGD